MYFSLGGEKRGVVLVAVALLSLGLSSCSSDKPSPLDRTKPTTTATPDTGAEAVDAYQRYWAVAVSAQNTANADPAQFKGIADGVFIEAFLNRMGNYADNKIKRVGHPKISGYEARVVGNGATIYACLDERGWIFERAGKQMKGSSRAHPQPVGVHASRRDGKWILVDELVSADIDKECA